MVGTLHGPGAASPPPPHTHPEPYRGSDTQVGPRGPPPTHRSCASAAPRGPATELQPSRSPPVPAHFFFFSCVLVNQESSSFLL